MAKLDLKRLQLVVVGAQLSAELYDRPVAYRLQNAMANWLTHHAGPGGPALVPILCTDVWYLNNTSLQRRPVVSVGGPGVNALSAYLYQKLPTALAVEDKLVVQMDLDLVDLRASVWGTDHRHTGAAMDLFEKKYLEEYLHAAINRSPGPEDEEEEEEEEEELAEGEDADEDEDEEDGEDLIDEDEDDEDSEDEPA